MSKLKNLLTDSLNEIVKKAECDQSFNGSLSFDGKDFKRCVFCNADNLDSALSDCETIPIQHEDDCIYLRAVAHINQNNLQSQHEPVLKHADLDNRFNIDDKVIIIDTGKCYSTHNAMAKTLNLSRFVSRAAPDKYNECVILSMGMDSHCLLYGVRTNDGQEFIISESGLPLSETT